ADHAAVAAACRRARAAQPAWAAAPLAARAEAIRRFRVLAVERAEPLARTLTLEVGKPITQARRELAGLLPRVDFFLAAVEGALADEVVLASSADGLEERIAREPLGLVANVSAWNYPWYVGANVFLPALLTGNAVLYKPSEFATLTGLAIAELLHEAGIPADVFQVLVGGGRVGGYVVGDPFDEHTYVGPLARREAAVAHQEAQVADALGRGARVLTGGRRVERPGFFFAPTVLVDVDHTMAVMREETFGPLIGLARAGSDDEAVALMNDTPYGLTAAVYTANRARAERVLARVNTGTAYWNCCDRVSPRLPWTGRGASGLGVTLSRDGIAAFVRPKAWHLRGAG